MIRIVVIALLILVAYFMIRSYFLPDPGESVDSAEMVQDPNCQVYLPKTEAVQRETSSATHCFCSEKCANEYEEKNVRS